jgi:hypothetical protein
MIRLFQVETEDWYKLTQDGLIVPAALIVDCDVRILHPMLRDALDECPSGIWLPFNFTMKRNGQCTTQPLATLLKTETREHAFAFGLLATINNQTLMSIPTL